MQNTNHSPKEEKTCTGRPMIIVVFLSQLKRADFMLTEKRTCIIKSAKFSSSSFVILMTPVSAKYSARSTIEGSFRRRSPSSNHFCADDNRPSLVQDKPPCVANKRLCVSSNHSGVGCVFFGRRRFRKNKRTGGRHGVLHDAAHHRHELLLNQKCAERCGMSQEHDAKL